MSCDLDPRLLKSYRLINLLREMILMNHKLVAESRACIAASRRILAAGQADMWRSQYAESGTIANGLLVRDSRRRVAVHLPSTSKKGRSD